MALNNIKYLCNVGNFMINLPLWGWFIAPLFMVTFWLFFFNLGCLTKTTSWAHRDVTSMVMEESSKDNSPILKDDFVNVGLSDSSLNDTK